MGTGCTPPCHDFLGHTPPPALPLREALTYRAEAVDVTLVDASGRAFHLEIQQETFLYAATYDRRGTLRARRAFPTDAGGPPPGLGRGRGPLEDGLRDLTRKGGTELHGRSDEAVKDFLRALREMDTAVRGFKRLLHRFLQANDPGHSSPVNAAGLFPRGEHPAAGPVRIEVAAVRQTVKIEVVAPDREAWSVESTAQRLRDFAVARYEEGDRKDHAAMMSSAMQRGYRQAEAELGHPLPESARTILDRARDLLTSWQDGDASSPEGETESPEPTPVA